MGNLPLLTRLRLFIGSIGWKLFIWGTMTTENQYWNDVYELEKSIRERRDDDDDY